jgi:hypothetical protein
MLTLEHALRRSVVTLGLIAAAGTAAAQGTPPADDDTTTPPEETSPDDTTRESTAPIESDTDVDVDVTTPPPPAPVVTTPAPQPTYTTPVYTDTDEDYEDSTLERYGIGVAVGGGVEGFTNDTMRDTTDDGGNWNVRLAFGTRSPIGFEAAYIGSAQDIDALGLDTGTVLVGNGAQGNVRVNLIDANIQPFALAGVAWRHYELTNSDFNTSDIAEDDDVLEIPLGVGLAWKYKGLMLDARGEFRIATEEDMVPELTGVANADPASMHRWGVNANVGYAF